MDINGFMTFLLTGRFFLDVLSYCCAVCWMAFSLRYKNSDMFTIIMCLVCIVMSSPWNVVLLGIS